MSRSDEFAHYPHTTPFGPWPGAIGLKSAFLGTVRERYPEAFRDLRTRAEACAESPEACEEWAAAWHLSAPWVHRVAHNTARMWIESPVAAEQLFLAYEVAVWSPLAPAQRQFEYQPWNPHSGTAIRDHHDAQAKAFRQHLADEAAETTAQGRAAGFVANEDKRKRRQHLTFLADWQVGGLNSAQIVERWKAEERETVEANTAYAGLQSMAAVIELTVREGELGRPS